MKIKTPKFCQCPSCYGRDYIQSELDQHNETSVIVTNRCPLCLFVYGSFNLMTYTDIIPPHIFKEYLDLTKGVL